MHQDKMEKITVRTLRDRKHAHKKITAVTSYDHALTRIVDAADIDVILVGDSLGMVLQGKASTLEVTLEQIVYHTRLVSSAAPHSLIVSDMPFGSYHSGREKAVENAIRCVKEGGAEAVKIEGGRKRCKVIESVINAEIPVMGHLGLTPQSVNAMGGFRVQGKVRRKAREILEDALALEETGVFALVLESIPMELAMEITREVSVPTIGIGAGMHCDGQILVFHDLVGFTKLYMPKFVRQYADLYGTALNALHEYVRDVREGNFPGESESYHLKKDIKEFLK